MGSGALARDSGRKWPFVCLAGAQGCGMTLAFAYRGGSACLRPNLLVWRSNGEFGLECILFFWLSLSLSSLNQPHRWISAPEISQKPLQLHLNP